MADFIITEAEVEEHKERSKPKRIKIVESDPEDEENDDQPTQSDNDFINDEELDENPNTSAQLELMEEKLAAENKKKRGHPPLNKKNEDGKSVYLILKRK